MSDKLAKIIAKIITNILSGATVAFIWHKNHHAFALGLLTFFMWNGFDGVYRRLDKR